MKLIVIMATRRWQNWPALRKNMETVRAAGGLELHWWPVLYHEEWEGLHPDVQLGLRADWITVIRQSPPLDGFNPILYKQNTALDVLDLRGSRDWCYFGADDDLLPHSVARQVQAADDGRARVIVCSCKRGQRTTVHSGYPPWPLIAEPGNMVPCAVTGSQAIVRADAFETPTRLRFRSHAQADGEMIQWLHQREPDAFRYLRDYYLPFNALEPDRWDAPDLADVLNQA